VSEEGRVDVRDDKNEAMTDMKIATRHVARSEDEERERKAWGDGGGTSISSV
jgi:hypothetical protein